LKTTLKNKHFATLLIFEIETQTNTPLPKRTPPPSLQTLTKQQIAYLL